MKDCRIGLSSRSQHHTLRHLVIVITHQFSNEITHSQSLQYKYDQQTSNETKSTCWYQMCTTFLKTAFERTKWIATRIERTKSIPTHKWNSHARTWNAGTNHWQIQNKHGKNCNCHIHWSLNKNMVGTVQQGLSWRHVIWHAGSLKNPKNPW